MLKEMIDAGDMQGVVESSPMRSSYIENDFCYVFDGLVEIFRPEKIVEFGALDGYSTMHLARAQGKYVDGGEMVSYDLWDDYPFKNGVRNALRHLLDEEGLDDVRLEKKSYHEWLGEGGEDFDLLHVDISNDGEILEETLRKVGHRIDAGGVLISEGGSEERDKIDGMVRYGKKPIAPVVRKHGGVVLAEAFPSLSLFKR